MPDEPNGGVEILLSTYNGARYLQAFLASLEAQTFTDWSLTVRDDGSADDTVDMLRRWGAAHPDKLRLLQTEGAPNLGVVGSFSALLGASVADYVMLADQDDIWLPHKIATTREAMARRVAAVGPNRPVLVHTDLKVVDEHLRTLSESVWRYQGLKPWQPPRFSRLIIENIVWGCTAMLNRALVRKIGDVPAELPHHDWWIALVAAAFGEVVSLPVGQILWRRHGLNESEVTSADGLPGSVLAGLPAAKRRLERVLTDARARASVFLSRYGAELAPSTKASAEALLNLPEQGWAARRADLLRHGLLFGSPVRNLGLFILV